MSPHHKHTGPIHKRAALRIGRALVRWASPAPSTLTIETDGWGGTRWPTTGTSGIVTVTYTSSSCR